MSDVDLENLLNLSKKHLKQAEKDLHKDNNINYRIAANLIVDFYNIVLLNNGKKLSLTIQESYDLSKKMFIISTELPEVFDEYEKVTKKVSNIRNKISHTNVSIPNKRELKYVIDSAEPFKNFVETKTHEKLTSTKKRRTLKEQYEDKTEFIRILLKNIYVGFEKASAESEGFNKVFQRLNNLKGVNIGNLDQTSIKSLISIADDTISDAEKVYEYIQSHCPECGGPLEIKTETNTYNKGPEDDPEPDYFEVYEIVKCSKCGHILETELLERETI
jgi:rRNA maturation endonuclease Nob1